MDTIEIIESFLREYFLYGAIITPIIMISLLLYYDDNTRKEVLTGDVIAVMIVLLAILSSALWFIVLPSIGVMGIVIGIARIIERIKNPPAVESST